MNTLYAIVMSVVLISGISISAQANASDVIPSSVLICNPDCKIVIISQ